MHQLCKATDIAAGSAKGFEVEAHALFVVNQGGDFFAYLNNCPHRGIRLEWQPDQFLDYERNFIQCATHGALFSIENGECIAGPCPGEKLTALACTLKDGQLWVELPEVTS